MADGMIDVGRRSGVTDGAIDDFVRRVERVNRKIEMLKEGKEAPSVSGLAAPPFR